MYKTSLLVVVLIGLLAYAARLSLSSPQEPVILKDQAVPAASAAASTPTRRTVQVQRHGPAGDAILLAVIAERTGPAGIQNEPVYAAVRFAIDRLNAQGGVLGRPLSLIEYDNGTNTILAAEAARLAIAEGAVAVIGSCRSANSLAMAQVLQPAGVPMVTPESTNPEVTRVGDCIFRACFTDDFQATVLAAFARERLGAATAVTITCANRLFSTGLSKRFGERFTALGGRVLWDAGYVETEASFAPIAGRLAESRPDVVFIPSEVRDSGLIMKQALSAGVATRWLGPDSWNIGLYEVVGPGAEGAIFSTHWHRDSDLPASRLFVADYERSVEPIRRAGVVMFYDAAMLVADALRRAGRADRAALRTALAATRDFPGVAGPITFAGSGDPRDKPAVILELRQGSEAFITLQRP
jgi:branched-chain amino acid transport system substrate-binding protein